MWLSKVWTLLTCFCECCYQRTCPDSAQSSQECSFNPVQQSQEVVHKDTCCNCGITCSVKVSDELLEANPRYAHIRHENSTESTISLSDLASLPRDVPVSTEDPLSPAEQSDGVFVKPPVETELPHGDSLILDHGVVC